MIIRRVLLSRAYFRSNYDKYYNKCLFGLEVYDMQTMKSDVRGNECKENTVKQNVISKQYIYR